MIKYELGAGDDEGLLVRVQDVGYVRQDAVLVLLDHRVADAQVRLVEDLVARERYATLENHDAPAVQHLCARLLVLLQQVGQVRVVVARGTPAKDPRQVVAGTQRQHTNLTLLLEIILSPR